MEVNSKPVAMKHTITMTELDENCVKKVKKEHLTIVQEEAHSKKKAQKKIKTATSIKKTVSRIPKKLNSSAGIPAPIILDFEGQKMDITGKKVKLTQVKLTLKPNFIAETRKELTQMINMKSIDVSSGIKFPNQFVDEILDMKVLLEEMESKMPKMTPNFSSIQKMVSLMPLEQLTKYCPRWASYLNEAGEVQFERSNISHLVEHPLQISPPTDPLKPVAMSVSFTKKERNDLLTEIWQTEFDKFFLKCEIDKSEVLQTR